MMRFTPALALALMFVGGCGPNGGGYHPPHLDLGGTMVIPCPNPPKDTDGDGISDKDEGSENFPPTDTDHDGVPDYKSQDSDGDGIPDAIEGRNANLCTPPVDSDNDGKPDFQDIDSDSATDSTMGDKYEAGPDPTHPADSDGDGLPDYMDPDNDNDGILDAIELIPQGAQVAVTMPPAPDTDGDGAADYLDTDSDGDGILDKYEGAVDTDGDGIPNYRDLDSDGDCISDAIEGGGGAVPVDTDGDGAPDFLDLDSDGEGLVDNLEDPNCNGVVDACETNRLLVDTDGDGVNDLIEHEDCAVKTPAQQAMLMCQCDGSDPAQNPLTHGDFVFVVDYMKTPTPTVETLNMSTDVSQADVVFALDSTGSMSGALTTLASNLAGFVPTIQSKVKSVAMGVVDFKDYGDNYVVQYDHRIQTVATAAGVTSVTNALKALSAGGGADYPEADLEALYAIAGGPAISIPGPPTGAPTAWSSTFNLGTVPPTTPTPGETQGNVGNAGFRAGSVPIVVLCTDANWHDRPGVAASGENGIEDYGSGTSCSATACNANPSRAMTVSALQNIGAHVMMLAGQGGGAEPSPGNPKGHGLALAQDTGAVVNVADFGPVGTRPSGCSLTQCCTGLNGVGETDTPAGSGLCPLSYWFDDTSGNGTSTSVVQGIVALANGLKFDIHVEAVDVDPMTVDNFMQGLVPNLSGMGPAAVCITMPPAALQDNFTGPHATPGMDGTLDTFPGVSGGKQICFDVIPKMNVNVMATSQPQFFRAQLQVKGVTGGNTVNLGTPRDVFFLVPPTIINGPIP